ncbi:unnamed protein product [Allacma fusca]|uniref:Uncharacterized protein n=1 Tax=Allacma fusca TaxID=39272 RepID=A0A8J2K0N9_9HEXA|nr:unnamed protein product [Allacma fusca]
MSGKKQTFSKPMPDTSHEICSQLIDDYDFEDDMRELSVDEVVKESDNRKAATARKRPIAGTSGTVKRAKTTEYNWTAAKPADADDPIVRAAMKDLCVRRSRTERFGHYLHFLKLRQVNGDITFHKRLAIQADAIPALIRCLTEIQNEIQAYPKQASINF